MTSNQAVGGRGKGGDSLGGTCGNGGSGTNGGDAVADGTFLGVNFNIAIAHSGGVAASVEPAAAAAKLKAAKALAEKALAEEYTTKAACMHLIPTSLAVRP